jgi:hypothetical protein
VRGVDPTSVSEALAVDPAAVREAVDEDPVVDPMVVDEAMVVQAWRWSTIGCVSGRKMIVAKVRV